MLRQSAERDRLERERQQLAQQQAREAAQAEQEHAAALESAQRDLEQAILAARGARRRGAGIGPADEAWRRAKARLIELETGSPPAWARDDHD